MRTATVTFLILTTLMLCLSACSGGKGRQAKYFERAQSHFEQGNYDKARVDIKNVLQIEDQHAGARYLFALLYEREKNWQQVFANLERAIELDPNMVKARLKIGQLYYAGRLYDKALEQAEAILRLQPDNPDAHALRGSVYFRQNKPEQAIREAEIALGVEPGHVAAVSILTEVYKAEDPERVLAVIGDGIVTQNKSAILKLLKIEVLAEQGRLDEVEGVFQELIADHPENLFFHYRLVNFYKKNKRIDKAESHLRNIVKNKPNNVDLKLWLAQFLANQRGLDSAEVALKAFLADSPENSDLQFALGYLYITNGHFDDAEAVYRAVIKSDEGGADSLKARNGLVQLALRKNDTAAAEAMLKEIFTLEPQNTEALLTRAKLMLARQESKGAINDLRSVLKNDPDSIDALLLLAQAHLKDDAVDLAKDNYRQVLDTQPGNNQALVALARLELNENNLANATLLLRSALRSAPLDTTAQAMLIEALAKQQLWDEALEQAQLLVERKGEEGLGFYLVGRVLAAKGEWGDALIAYQQSLEISPLSVEALNGLVEAYLAQEKPGSALSYLESHLKSHNDQAHAYELVGTLYERAGRQADAVVAFNRAIALRPESLSGYIGLAGLYIRDKKYTEAKTTYQRGLDVNPGNVQLMLLLANTHQLLGDYPLAAELYESVLKREPANLLAANNLAMLYVEPLASEENKARALDLAQRFRTLGKPELLDTLGWVHYKLGDSAAAINLLQSAIELGGDNPIYHYHLGMAYFEDNQLTLAKQSLRLALKKGKQFNGREKAEELLARL